ncbi:MAG: hypothetical protein LASZOEIN_001382, partial [Candidatus Fervidibacter sp.]
MPCPLPLVPCPFLSPLFREAFQRLLQGAPAFFPEQPFKFASSFHAAEDVAPNRVA